MIEKLLPGYSSINDTENMISSPVRYRRIRCFFTQRSAIFYLSLTFPTLSYASDFTSLIVFFIVLGVAFVLGIQTLMAIIFVIDGTYSRKSPALFVGIATGILCVGLLSLLAEMSHFGEKDLLFRFIIMLIPGFICIVLPLLQSKRAKSKVIQEHPDN